MIKNKKIYNTFEMVQYLLRSKNTKETFIKLTNPDFHVFKCIDGQLCYGIYGNGAINIFKLKCNVKELCTEWILEKEYKKHYKGKKRQIFKLSE